MSQYNPATIIVAYLDKTFTKSEAQEYCQEQALSADTMEDMKAWVIAQKELDKANRASYKPARPIHEYVENAANYVRILRAVANSIQAGELLADVPDDLLADYTAQISVYDFGNVPEDSFRRTHESFFNRITGDVVRSLDKGRQTHIDSSVENGTRSPRVGGLLYQHTVHMINSSDYEINDLVDWADWKKFPSAQYSAEELASGLPSIGAIRAGLTRGSIPGFIEDRSTGKVRARYVGLESENTDPDTDPDPDPDTDTDTDTDIT